MTAITSMAHLQLVQSVYVQGGFLPALSDCKNLNTWSLITAIESEDHYSKPGSTVRHIIFVIGWEKSRAYRRQSFVVMRGRKYGRNVYG